MWPHLLIIYLKYCAKVLSQSLLYRLLTQNLSVQIFRHVLTRVLILYLMIRVNQCRVRITHNCEMVSLGSLLPAACQKHTPVVSISLVQSKISHFDINIFEGEKPDESRHGVRRVGMMVTVILMLQDQVSMQRGRERHRRCIIWAVVRGVADLYATMNSEKEPSDFHPPCRTTWKPSVR